MFKVPAAGAVGAIMKISTVCGLLLLLQMGGTVTRAQSPENAKGTPSVNGKTTELHYAYARQRNDMFDKNIREVRVVLADVPVHVFDLEDDSAVTAAVSFPTLPSE